LKERSCRRNHPGN